MFPASDQLSICFAHIAYRLHERFSALGTGIGSFAVRDPATLEKRVGEADVLVVSGLWQNTLLDRAGRLRFIQSIGAGTDQFPRDELKRRGVRLASARGVNARAVAEHAMALILALSRRLPEARDNQGKQVWRGMIGEAFDMHVIGLRRVPLSGRGAADAVHRMDELNALLPEADFVALTCPLTKETESLIDAQAFGQMRPSAHLVNVARGRILRRSSPAASGAAAAQFPLRGRSAVSRLNAAPRIGCASGFPRARDRPAPKRRDP